MPFYDLHSQPYKFKREGVHVKYLTGERCQMVLVRLEPGFLSDHQHPEEQLGMVIAGTVELTIGADKKVLGEGEGYRIPANVRHSFRVFNDRQAEILDIFSPPKDE